MDLSAQRGSTNGRERRDPADRLGTPEALVFLSGDVECAAWYYRPMAGEPAPCVVLAHGFDGVVDQGLDAYARRFVKAGMAAFAFDYRCFGASRGEPRQLLSNRRQLEDWRAAIEHVRGLDGVDATRIALWGTSTSGGHVVKLAAQDASIAAVVVQMPFADGLAQFRNMPLTQSLRLLWAGLKDQVGSWLGLPPLLVQAAGRPRSPAVVTTADTMSGLARVTPPDSTWRNEVTARFALTTTFYRPVRAARRLDGRPLLVCIADADRLIPAGPGLELARHGELRRYPFSHFGMYYDEGFERAVSDQVDFLRSHLIDGRLRALT